jgi:hypothetical protein
MIKADAAEFAEKGYTIARGFFTREEAAEMLAEVERRMPHEDVQDSLTDGALIFTANVFKGSEIVQNYLSQQRLIDFMKDVTGGDLWVRWDQAVTKRPGAGVFHWHQDNGYNGLVTEHYQLWIALTETRNQNGALWLAPGSHRKGLLPHKATEGSTQKEVPEEYIGETECVDANIGDVILFSSLMLHRTGPNFSEHSRVAYVAEYMPLKDYDFALKKGPFFVVAEDGKSNPHFIDRQRGAGSLKNQLKYWKPRSKELIESVKSPLRAVKKKMAK